MRLVERAEKRPKACLVSGRGDGPLVDFQNQFFGHPNEADTLYLHHTLVEEAGQMLGMMRAKDAKELTARVEELETELDAVVDAVKEAGDVLARQKRTGGAFARVRERIGA